MDGADVALSEDADALDDADIELDDADIELDDADIELDVPFDAGALVPDDEEGIDDGGNDGGDGSADGGSVDAMQTGDPESACATPLANGEVLLDVGHAQALSRLRLSGTRALSLDAGGRWIFWDVAGRARITQGSITCTAPCATRNLELGNQLFIVQNATELQLHQTSDGALLRGIPFESGSFGVERTGRYAWTATASGLNTWSPAGEPALSHSGNYLNAQVFAAPDALLIAFGPAGANVIERVTLAGASSSSPPFLGSFSAWFGDGDRFLTSTGNTVRAYSAAATQEKVVSVSTTRNLGGLGAYFWTFQDASPEYPLEIYRVDAGAAPVWTRNFAATTRFFASGQSLALFSSSAGSGTLVDLSGSTPAATDVEVPTAALTHFASRADGAWAVSDSAGVIYARGPGSAASHTFGCGSVKGIASSQEGLWAIAVSANQVLLVDVPKRSIRRVIEQRAGKVALSDDATVLAAAADASAAQYLPDRSLRLYALPAGTISLAFASSVASPPYLFDFAMTADGSRVLRIACTPGVTAWACDSNLTDLADMTSYFAQQSAMQLDYPFTVLSRTGTHVAVAHGRRSSPTPRSTTNMYRDGILMGAATGYPVAWLDEQRLLLNTFWEENENVYFERAIIVDPQGAEQARPPLPEMAGCVASGPDHRCAQTPASLGHVQALQGGALIYSSKHNAVYDVMTGEAVWTAPERSDGAAAASDDHVLYARGAQVLIRPYSR